MQQKVIQEDDILDIASKFLSSNNFLILAVGGNQAGSFRFKINSKKTKAPDLVAFRYKYILVFEAKVRAKNLFSKTNNKYSDYECVSFLINSKSAKDEIKENAERMMSLLKIEAPNNIEVIGGLIAGDDFSDHLHKIKEKELLLLYVDAETEGVTIFQNKLGI